MVTPSHGGPATPGTSENLTATSGPDATPVHEAGRAFTVSAEARNAGGNLTSRYDGTPTASFGGLLQPLDGVAGTLTVGSWSTTGGVARTDSARYGEVGAFTIAIEDSSFASVDQEDGTPASRRRIGPNTSGVGRFIPDRFQVDSSSLTNRVNRAAASGEPFTYLGEVFRADHTLTARSASGGVTQNYQGSFAHLDPNSLGELGTEAYGKSAFLSLSGRLSGSANGTFNLGSASIDLDLQVDRDGTPEEPFDPLKVGIDPQDADDVTLQAGSLDDVDGNGDGDFRILVEPELVYGRLVVENAHGPETAELPVPVTAQSYADNAFQLENRDNATPLGAARINLTDPPADDLGASDTGIAEVHDPLMAGEGGLVLTAPGAGNLGRITVTADALSFLEFDFNNDGTIADPAGIVTFGRFRGNDRILFWREVYQ